MRESHVRFIRQQGFAGARLSRQPLLFRVDAATQNHRRHGRSSASCFKARGSSWCCRRSCCGARSFRARNPFDAIYNHAVADPRGLPPLGAAPAPRRFAQAMAGTVALAIGAALLLGATTAAWIVEGLFVVALMVLIFGNFCVGSCAYQVLQQRLPMKHQSSVS